MQPITSSGDSVLKKSNQAWKLQAMYLSVAASAALMIFANWRIDDLTAGQFALVMLSGMAIGLGGLVLACLAIRCPTCRARWLWRAVSTQPSGSWIHWLHSQASCPACGAHARDAT